ncbi:hypothetical protein DSL72_007186 [Monilinia vaccinii-corymbosi]|uniref:Uncharacterized protein n=1 Tax=Monilinia vaccinii-corymbosi TaxID=61207 RepID=A0A8A3PKZ3_9HELO|nr:hypothetical protein DSL72_007186 [Monilinia vaccinii-corymbosi]
MGIPYSKQIHAAFSQSQILMTRLQTEVTPLVAAGYPLIASSAAVLKTTKNIAVLLACVQVYTALMLTLHFAALLLLLVSVNPDLEGERRGVVTPVLRAVVQGVEGWRAVVGWGLRVGRVGCVVGVGVAVAVAVWRCGVGLGLGLGGAGGRERKRGVVVVVGEGEGEEEEETRDGGEDNDDDDIASEKEKEKENENEKE